MAIALKIKAENNDILAGCVRGDRLYQKKLYELFHGKMLSICIRYARDREEARDILNEGFMKVFLNIHKYKPEKSLESWIRRIMVNNAIDHYRKYKKLKKNVELDDTYVHPHQETITHQLAADEILGLVQQLSPSYRMVFNLYVIEGYNHREIGEKLGISEGTSKSNLAKARGKLQLMIKKLYQE